MTRFRIITAIGFLMFFGWQHLKADEVLFDGKTLAGWEGNLKIWRVENGTIAGGSYLGNPQNEFLTSQKSYKNFVLKLEFKLDCKGGDPNAGVQIRSKRITNPPHEMSGYQADIGALRNGDSITGSLYDESRRKKFLVQADPLLLKKIEKPNDWNKMEVRCENNRIEIFINGEKTCDFKEEDNSIEKNGVIGLQIHGNNKAVAYYRNISIKTLPD